MVRKLLYEVKDGMDASTVRSLKYKALCKVFGTSRSKLGTALKVEAGHPANSVKLGKPLGRES